MEQLDLIAEKKPLMRTYMIAGSSRRAWYELCIFAHPGGGFLVQKRSGSCEIWFRWKYSEAYIKFRQIIDKKQNRTRKGRVYNSMEES